MMQSLILSGLLGLSIFGYRMDTMQQNAIGPALSGKDSVVRTVTGFLSWYKSHADSISRIILVDQKPGKNYAVNFKNGEKYLTYLRSSQRLTDRYLNEWRLYFRERQQGFQLSPQNEGPPTGFEYDLVLLSQEVDTQLASLNKLKIEKVTVRKDRASVEVDLLANYEFRLVRQNGVWRIDEILNLSAE
ncbi:hypothetical protein ACO2Q8_11630 [Larkinella sp. VNQ87]|uniref:hypothetical protein n=1 Tax=Larkinella sp. VNQ87 TaxID=3400921 RepID=UPI003C106213